MEIISAKEVTFEEKSVQETEKLLLDNQAQEQAEKAKAEAEKAEADKLANSAPPEIDDTVVLSHINKKANKEYKSLDEVLTPTQVEVELPEDVAAYYKYKKETGRSIADYISMQRDFTKEDPKKLLAEYMAIKNPDLDKEDIAHEMSKFDYDEDLDEKSDVKSKQVAMKKELSKAIAYFNEQKEQYKIPLESSTALVPDAEKEQYEAFKRKVSESKTELEQGKVLSDYFVQKTNELFDNKDFKGFEFKVGDKSFTFSPTDAEKLKQAQTNVANFVGSHLDEKGFIKDAGAYHKALAVAMNPDTFATHFYEQGKADAIAQQAIDSKNINMGAVRSAPQFQVKEGTTARLVEDDFGSGLKIPTPRK